VRDPRTALAVGVASTPLGRMHLAATGRGLCWAAFDPWRGRVVRAVELPAADRVAAASGPSGDVAENGPERSAQDAASVAASALLAQAIRAIDAWFARTSRALDVPLDVPATDWQRRVWAAAAHIRFGDRVTYGELAARLGRVGAARAVGTALGANPCLLFTPCHRVVGRGGRLTGYAGGIERKRALLAFESDASAPAVR